MSIPQYIFQLANVAESNETLIAKKVLRVLDCSTNLTDDNACSLWRFTKCVSDQDYCNPYVPGDKIYFQKFVVVGERDTTKVFAEVYDSSTDQPIVANGLATESGVDSNGVAYGNFIIDTEGYNVKCFYLKIKVFNCELTPAQKDEIKECVDSLVEQGKTQSEAQEICYGNYCDALIYYSEPYCYAPCQNTVLLEGFYPAHDCYGYYYGPFTVPGGAGVNSYKNQIRVFASVESNNFVIDETTTNGTDRTNTQLTESFLFRNTFGVPYYVANKIATIFAAKTVYMDGEVYTNTNNVDKNNDENNMWYISTNATKVCANNDFSCDT